MRAIISRFAPAPTGFLHLGHVVNAIHVWGLTGSPAEGRVLLRIEDHDRQRSRSEFESAILEDLEWLGFRPDAPMVRQSERGDIYSAALDRLRASGLVYACGCSRAEIAGASVRAGLPSDDELRYPGTCRDRGLADAPDRGLRVRFEPSVERFVDERHGPLEQRPSEQCGDLLVRDREGNWTYQFAATVDDMVQEVTFVIRGDDLLASTGRQLQLARLLGRTHPPRFLHHPLIMKSPFGVAQGDPERVEGPPLQKLSKSDRDTGVRDLRAQGWTPERVVGQAAAMAGLVEPRRPVSAAEVSALFER
jgi:glutamyl-tRNA synthetase/glutamyl-Q tRNA(Asp) synthetase